MRDPDRQRCRRGRRISGARQARLRTAQGRESLSIPRIDDRRRLAVARPPSASSDTPTTPPSQIAVPTFISRALPSLSFRIGRALRDLSAILRAHA